MSFTPNCVNCGAGINIFSTQSIHHIGLTNYCHNNKLLINIHTCQGCILPPCPQGHGQGGFFVQKKIDERFQSNCHILIFKNEVKDLRN